MDVKTRKLIGVNREIVEEAIKSLNIGAKVLARRRRAMWDILLASEDSAKALTSSIMTTKSVRLQTEYLWNKKSKVILHRVLLYIALDHLGFSFSKFGEVASYWGRGSYGDVFLEKFCGDTKCTNVWKTFHLRGGWRSTTSLLAHGATGHLSKTFPGKSHELQPEQITGKESTDTSAKVTKKAPREYTKVVKWGTKVTSPSRQQDVPKKE